MLVISTAGWDQTSIAWEVRALAQREADWYFSSRGQCASWISPAWLEQQRRTLPSHVFARLHENRWVAGVGAFLRGTEVDAVFASDLPAGSGAVAIGLDLGLVHDSSVIAAVRRDYATGLVVVEDLETWRPSGGLPVDLQHVEDAVTMVARKFAAPVVIDPWQGVLLGQRLQARGVRVTEFPFTGENRRKLFGALLDLVRNGRLRCRPHEDLRRELLSLEVQETASGWRVDHKVGRHDDHVVAVGLAAQAVTGEAASHRPAAGAFVPRHIRETLRDLGSVGRSEF
jgi:hypothetical protein